jgi:hypothetical protein
MNSHTAAMAAPEITCGAKTMPVTAVVPGSFIENNEASAMPSTRLTPTTTTTHMTVIQRTFWKDSEANSAV